MKNANHIACFLSLCFFTTFTFSQDKYRNFITDTNVKEKKGLALVLANDNYENINPLDYSVEDAEHIIKSLKSEGVDIEVGFNLNLAYTRSAIADFAKKLPSYEYAIIYYSGHGVQKEGENYLIPTDAKGNAEWQFKATTININEVFKKLEQFNKPKILILDACRNNPFEDLKSMVKGKGLALIKALDDSVVVFATSPDTAVKDTNQFTEIFSKEINKGGCIMDIIKKTRRAVKQKYPNQSVYAQDNLTGDICFGNKTIGTSKDSDGDGVIDDVDKCPNEFGLVQYSGCPKSFNFKMNKNLNEEELKEFIKDTTNIVLLKKEANSDNQFALYNLGRLYLTGLGSFQRNSKKALEFFERSANFGNSWAMNNIGHTYECGNPKTKSYYSDPYASNTNRDYGLAFEWFKQAAKNNNSTAYYNLAVMYHKGYGTEENFDEAKKWYIRAGHTGNSKAHYILGKHYFENEEWEQAYYWFKEAISNNDFDEYGEVNYRIGVMYFDGLHVDKNYELAYRYIKKAKDLKYSGAYYVYGLFYEDGIIVDRNQETAKTWYKKGCEVYDNRACNELGKYRASSSITSSNYKKCYTDSN